ncbi:MAG: hypothetical protein IJV38_07935 [Prevotella sp.]|nr:hypothetical protein [Prevotella sp.]
MSNRLKELLVKQVDVIATASHYSELLSIATLRINSDVNECRRKYGIYTYAQWYGLFREYGINIDEIS